MTAEAWSVIVAAIGIAVAIGFQIAEWRRNRFSRAVDIISGMDGRWESPEFREVRRVAAKYLLEDSPKSRDPQGDEATRTILNFFETVGFLRSRKILDSEMIWHFFGSTLLPYYVAAKSVREVARSSDPNCFTEVGKLYAAISKVERSVHPSGDTLHILSPPAIKDFLVSECGLELSTIPSTTPA